MAPAAEPMFPRAYGELTNQLLGVRPRRRRDRGVRAPARRPHRRRPRPARRPAWVPRQGRRARPHPRRGRLPRRRSSRSGATRSASPSATAPSSPSPTRTRGLLDGARVPARRAARSADRAGHPHDDGCPLVQLRGAQASVTQLLADLDAWIDAHWDPALTVGEWWELVGAAGWAAPSLPAGARRARCVARRSGGDRRADRRRAARWPARGGPGLSVVAPRARRRTSRTTTSTPCCARPSTGALAWCLLFSEPGAGTDLANLTTTATRDGDGWRLDGRKTWATGAHVADRASSSPAATRPVPATAA